MLLSQMINGCAALEIRRDASIRSLGFHTGTTPQRLIFVEDRRWLLELERLPDVAAVLTTPEIAEEVPPDRGLAVAAAPRRAFYELHNVLATRTAFYDLGIGRRIASSASIHPNASIADRAVVIGERVRIEPHVTVLAGCIIGDDCVLRAGVVLGGEGFQFDFSQTPPLGVVHAGGVRLGSRVEIQANSAVDRALFGGFTELSDDTKLDNMVHVAHGVHIGRRCRVAAQAMIAGSTVIGDDVWIGPSAAIADNLCIGDGARITIGAVVTRNVGPGQRVTGNFAVEHGRFIAHLKSMP